VSHDNKECELNGWYKNEVQKLVDLVVVVLSVVEDEVVEVKNPL